MIAAAVAMWLAACQVALPPQFVPLPVPRYGIPRGETPIRVSPLPDIKTKGEE